MQAASERDGVRLTLYGLFRWAADKYGSKALFGNVLTSEQTVDGYSKAARLIRDDMPAAVVNAGNYLKSLTQQMGDIALCMSQLSRMSFPYIIYVLFAGAGMQKYAAQFRGEFEEHMRRYPSTLDALPERYRLAGREETDADAE